MQIVTAAIIRNEGKYLIAKRKVGGVVGGKWEFPGGKIENDELPQNGLQRELKEELDAEAMVGEFFDEHIHRYKTGIIRVFAYMVDCLNYQFNLSEHDEVRWVSADQFSQFDFTGNGKPIVKKLSSV
jgi:8-oxo-dGTP diphosphatase